jgi:hypothetical protein
MQTTLIFSGKLKADGTLVEQRIPVSDPDILGDRFKLMMFIQAALVQLGVGGMVHKDGNTMKLIPGANFETIWCDIPSIIIASPNEAPTKP